MAQLVLHRRAARYFERLDERLKAQLRARLEELARDPLAMAGVKPMAGEWRGFLPAPSRGFARHLPV